MAADNDIVISTKNLSKVYKLYKDPKDRLKEALSLSGKVYHKDFYALKDINLEIKRGEVIGIVGKNGSGKSTLLKIISKVLTPTSGEVVVKGKISSLLELGSGFNPELTGIENIFFYATILGITEQKIKSKLQEILDFADIGDFVYQPLKTYSSGMRARLAFSVAINVDPDILILDEVLAVGDELFKRKCYARMERFFKGGKTVLFVSHSISSINLLCTRAILLNNGECLLGGPTKMVTTFYQKLLFADKFNIQSVIKEIRQLEKDELKKIQFRNETEGESTQGSSVKLRTNKDEENASIDTISKAEIQTTKKLKAYFVPNFIPKSSVETKNLNIDINDFLIRSSDGEIVNHLVTGDFYIFEYKVRFEETLSNINFGMGIKSEKGVPISWIIYPMPDEYLEETFLKGSEIIVSTRFQCHLLQGTYYLDSGIRINRNGSKEVAIKKKDCHVFKVQKDKDPYGGMISLTQEVTINKLN